MIRSPVLQPSPSFSINRLDNALASNAYYDHDQVPIDSPRSDMPSEPDHRSKHKSQTSGYINPLNLQHRDGRPANLKMLNNANPPPRQRPARYNSDLVPSSPFLSNASAAHNTSRGISNPYLSNRPLQPLIPGRSSSPFYDSQTFWLGLYFVFNLGLTLFNKGVLLQFPFPYTLTAIHALCGSIGGYIMLEAGLFVPARLETKETISLVAFSVLYAVNIVVSNMSLHLVTVPVRHILMLINWSPI